MFRSSAQSLSRGVFRSVAAARRSGGGPATRTYATPTGSPSRTSKSSSNVAVAAGLGVVTVIGGCVAYAAADKDFRRYVETNLPGSGTVLTTLFGQLEPPAADKKVSDVTVKKTVAKSAPAPVTSVTPIKKRAPSAAPDKDGGAVEGGKDAVKATTIVSPVLVPPLLPLDKPPEIADPAVTKVHDDTLPGVSSSEGKQARREDVEKAATTISAQPDLSVSNKKCTAPADKLSKPTQVETGGLESEHLLLSKDDIVDLHGDEAMDRDVHRKVTEIREELEAQMIKQLKRQAEAHADHIRDSLDVQRKEISR